MSAKMPLSDDLIQSASENIEDACESSLVTDRDVQTFDSNRLEARVGEEYIIEWLRSEIDEHMTIREVEKNHGHDLYIVIHDVCSVEVKSRNLDKYPKHLWDDRRDLIVRHREALDNDNQIDESALADLYVQIVYSEREGWIEVVGWAARMQVEQARWLRSPDESDGGGDDTPALIVNESDLMSFEGTVILSQL